MPESSRQPELAASTSIGSMEVQGPRGGPRAAPGTGSEFEPRSPLHSDPPHRGGFLFPESCRGAPYKAPLCRGGWTPPGGLGDCLSKTTGQRGFPADGERNPTQGKEVPRTTRGVSATGGDERFPGGGCGFRHGRGRKNPHSVWGTVGPTILFSAAKAAPLFCREAALIYLCGQRAHFFQKRFQALNISRHGRGTGVTHTPCGGRSAPPSLFYKKRRCRLAVPEKNRRGQATGHPT